MFSILGCLYCDFIFNSVLLDSYIIHSCALLFTLPSPLSHSENPPSHSWMNAVVSPITLPLTVVKGTFLNDKSDHITPLHNTPHWPYRIRTSNVPQGPWVTWCLPLPPASSPATFPLLAVPQPNSPTAGPGMGSAAPCLRAFTCCSLSLECSDTLPLCSPPLDSLNAYISC